MLVTATPQDVIDAAVDPAWAGIAAELIVAFPEHATARERIHLLFSGLHHRLRTTDWVACAALHRRITAFGHMDHHALIGDLHPAGGNPDADALRLAVATALL